MLWPTSRSCSTNGLSRRAPLSSRSHRVVLCPDAMSQERRRTLRPWVRCYSRERQHASVGYQPPLTRLGELLDEHVRDLNRLTFLSGHDHDRDGRIASWTIRWWCGVALDLLRRSRPLRARWHRGSSSRRSAEAADAREPKTRDHAVVLDGLFLAAFAATMLTIGGAALDAAAMASLFFGGTIVAIAGSVIVIWTVGDAYPSHHVMAILLGSLATSLVLLFGCMTTGTLAAKVFLVWSGVVLAAGAWTLRSAPEAEHRDGLDVLAIAAIAILVVARCHDAASTLPSIQATGIVPSWSDYSIHGTEIAQFGDPHVQTLSSFLLAGQPLVFYHYASYMLPAAAAGVVSLPPWGVATSLLLPYGILLMSLAVYAFARTRLGTVAAMIAPAALLLIPNASAYGCAMVSSDFSGVVRSPGERIWLGRRIHRADAGGDLACASANRVPLARALRDGVRLRVQGAHLLLLAPATVAALLCETTFVRRHLRILTLAAALTVIIVIICLGKWQSARDAWLRFSVPRQFLEVVHTGMSPTAYDGAYKAIDGRYGPLVGTTLGLLALIPAALGAFAIALPIAGAAAVRRTGWLFLDTFPMWCVTAWFGVVLLAPTANFGDYTELQQRPFVLVYASAVVWTLLFVERALPAACSSGRGLRLALSTAVVAGIAIAVLAERNEDPARPRFAWGMQYFDTIVERRIIDTAAFVRTHAAVGDTFAVIPPDPAAWHDDATRLAALAGVPAYLARAGIQARNDEARRLVVEQRLSELQRIATASDPNAAFGTLRTIGVDFLVSLGDGGPSFNPSGSRAAFRTTGAAVYRIGPER